MNTENRDFMTADLVPRHDRIDLEQVWKRIDEEVSLYVSRTPKSAERFEEAKRSMVNGTPNIWWNHWRLPDPRTNEFLLPHLWYWDRAKNQRCWDVDGNEYVDYLYADTPTVWGHAPDNEYTRGIAEAIRSESFCSLVPNDEALVVTQLLQKMIDLKYWFMSLSASDANRSGINIARIVTGRRKVLSPNFGYMGGPEEGMYWKPSPNLPPVTRWAHYVGASPDPAVKIAEFNDLDSVEDALKDRDVAVFVTEPLMTDGGFVVPRPGFFEGVRELCDKYGTLLLIDETHTLATTPRGMFTEMDLKGDLWTTGKAIAGGIPCGVLGMSEEVGDAYAAKVNDLTVPGGAGVISCLGQGTTMAANPVSVRALRLALEHYYTEETYGKMVGAMDHLCAGLRDVIARRGVDFSITQNGVRMHLNFVPTDSYTSLDAVRSIGLGGYHEYFTLFALNRGFVVMPWENMILTSTYTTTEDNDRFIAMFDECVGNMLGE